MAQLPQFKAKKDNITVLNAFLGINKGLHIQEHEFQDMKNMTNDYYPVLSNRRKRGIMPSLRKPQGFLGGQCLAYVDDDVLYYDGAAVLSEGKSILEPTGEERQLVMMGAYLCVFPDGIVYNTYTNTHSSIENKRSSSTVKMTLCKFDGSDYENVFIGKTEPDHATYLYWLDTSQKTAILKMYSSNYSMWTSVATTYVRIEAPGIGKGFKDYDSVKFSGITKKGYNDYDFNQTLIVYKAADDYLMVAGLIDAVTTINNEVTVIRTFPEMDYVCELDNRIWGCSSLNHEIYACKLGDPYNWYAYAGLDSDSYAATVGTQGDFTGIAAYSGYVMFFKEEGFHKLYGTKPSNYELIWKPCRGIASGSNKSVAVVDEVLFYKSRDAIVAYDGGTNTVSDTLGIEPYYDAVGVGYRNKYYVSMRDAEYRYRLYVYDITKGAWCIEDDIRCLYMAYADNAVYGLTSNNELFIINNEKIYKQWFPSEDIYPSEDLYPGATAEGDLESDFNWSFTTGDLGLDNPYNKYLKRINLRMQLGEDANVKIEVEYDSSGEWEYVKEYSSTRIKSFEIPIAVKRADHVRLRLSGIGEFKLFSIAKAVEAGSGVDAG